MEQNPDEHKNWTRREILAGAGLALAGLAIEAYLPAGINSDASEILKSRTKHHRPHETVSEMSPRELAGRLEEALPAGPSIFLVPHPDDEVAAAALEQRSKYPIFVLLTQGEQSQFCDFYGGRGSEECKRQRVDDWLENQRLNGYSVGPAEQRRGFVLRAGENSAQLLFDYGDQGLTPRDVHQALLRAEHFSRQLGKGENQLIVSACEQYGHPDHKAVYEAVRGCHGSSAGRAAINGKAFPATNASLAVSDFPKLKANFNKTYGWLHSDGTWPDDQSIAVNESGLNKHQQLEVFALPPAARGLQKS